MLARREPEVVQPSLTVIAGPNGSGKTTLTQLLGKTVGIGVLVNADQMAARIAGESGLSIDDPSLQMKAAVAAEEMRWALLDQRVSFVAETVMSDRARWIRFFEEARKRGFKRTLVFVTTNDPEVNVARVAQRVAAGGHNVDRAKIIDRYRKVHDFLPEALRFFDEAWFFDNSSPEGKMLLVMTSTAQGGLHLECTEADVPAWAKHLARLVADDAVAHHR